MVLRPEIAATMTVPHKQLRYLVSIWLTGGYSVLYFDYRWIQRLIFFFLFLFWHVIRSEKRSRQQIWNLPECIRTK
jgi:hypothetical protein